MLHTNPGGRPSKLDLDNNLMRDNIADLRLSHGSTSKMVLLLSFSTDLMIRSIHMYPEVWFLDVTARSNKQKRNLFVLVGRKPSGNSFISNVTLIPSGKFCCVCIHNLCSTFGSLLFSMYRILIGQAWVYRTCTRLIYPHLFGAVTVQRNRMGLTDEERAEYETFERNIAIDPNYCNSTLMLCCFHAIWMFFREKVRPHLPKKGQFLTAIGKEYGKAFF